MKSLAIEDDDDTANYVVKGLTQQGHEVDRAPNGRDGLFLAAGKTYDVLIVDRMLPGLDGLAIVKTIRGAGVKTPILLLTAVEGIDDRVEGLEAGGDDYLVKPFAFAELAARVNALDRRPALAESVPALCVGDLQMDLLRRIVRRGDQVIELQPREFRLLEYLMRHPGQLVTRTMLLEHVWGRCGTRGARGALSVWWYRRPLLGDRRTPCTTCAPLPISAGRPDREGTG